MISVVYSTEHLLMPKIIGTLLVIMLAVIVLVEGRERKAATGKFFGSFGPFFRENADFKKLFGTSNESYNFHPGTCHCQSNFWCCFQYYASQRNLQYHLH